MNHQDIECNCRKCMWNSDYKVPNDGRPWVSVCIYSIYRGRVPMIDKDGRCDWMKVVE